MNKLESISKHHHVLLFVITLCGMLSIMTACTTTKLKSENGMILRTAGETNLFRPSLSVMQVLVCEPQEGVTETIKVDDGESQTCPGRFVPIATTQGTQAGALTGLGGAMVQGGSIVGAGYLIGKGIGDSGSETNVTQEGGGASATGGSSSNLNLNSATGGQGGSGYGYGGNATNKIRNTNQIRPRWGCD